jgi:hypothetical protein
MHAIFAIVLRVGIAAALFLLVAGWAGPALVGLHPSGLFSRDSIRQIRRDGVATVVGVDREVKISSPRLEHDGRAAGTVTHFAARGSRNDFGGVGRALLPPAELAIVGKARLAPVSEGFEQYGAERHGLHGLSTRNHGGEAERSTSTIRRPGRGDTRRGRASVTA